MSVGDILESSFAPRARELSEFYRNRPSTNGNQSRISASSSSFSSYNGSRSLPRTADLSQLSNDTFGAQAINDSAFGNEEFEAGELMMSKLIQDEIEWAQEQSVVPTKLLSKEAKSRIYGSSNNTFTEDQSLYNIENK